MTYARLLGSLFVVALSCSAFACSGGDPSGVSSSGGTAGSTAGGAGGDGGGPGTYSLDLSAFPGGLDQPNSQILFPVDLSRHDKTITKLEPAQVIELDSRFGCFSGSEFLEMASANAGIPAGDSASVGAMDLVFATHPDLDMFGVCYGFRTPGGKWHYDVTKIDPKRSGDKLRAHVPVAGDPVDALGIAFWSNYPTGALEIHFTVE